MSDGSFETFTGVKLVALVCGFVGGALGVIYTPQITPRMAVGACIAAVVCGGFAPAALEWGFNTRFPTVVTGIIGVVFGVGGMFIVPGLITAWKEFSADPAAFIKKWREIFASFVGGGKGGAQ